MGMVYPCTGMVGPGMGMVGPIIARGFTLQTINGLARVIPKCFYREASFFHSHPGLEFVRPFGGRWFPPCAPLDHRPSCALGMVHAESRRRGGGEIVDNAAEAFFECFGSKVRANATS